MRKRFLALLMITGLTVGLLSGCGKLLVKTDNTSEKTEESSAEEIKTEKTEEETERTKEEKDDFVGSTESEDAQEIQTEQVDLDTSSEVKGIHHAEIKVKSYGTIKLELDANVAPITVTNFIKLAQEDFYDGLTFHRIIDGFMMQGGDPLGNGTGGSKENIKGEFTANGVENNLSHARGAVSMARASAPNSASSQFFIVQTDSHYLDGQYAVFGYVTEGMEIVDKICKDAEPIDQNGLIAADKQPVITDITIID